MMASYGLTAFDNNAEISAKRAGPHNRAHMIRPLVYHLSRIPKANTLRLKSLLVFQVVVFLMGFSSLSVFPLFS